MHLANSTTKLFKKISLYIFVLFSSSFAIAQENSPYSRYGMGDLVPSQNLVSRSMGGVSAGFLDIFPIGKSLNSLNISNPATLGQLKNTVFDIGVELDRRTLKSNKSPDKFTANNLVVSYLQLGFPITTKKMQKKGNALGVSFGLKPVTKVNYKIISTERLTNIDSVTTLFEGIGGINQANISAGLKIKDFSFGFTTGYNFGNKETNSKREFINDTINYASSNSDVRTNFGGLFINLGTQYEIKLKNKSTIRIGATANLQHNLKGKRDKLDETFIFGSDGSVISIDTVFYKKDESGVIKMPSSYTAGFTYMDKNNHWIVGADINYSSWSNYRFFGATDAVKNSTKLHVGAQYFPASDKTPISKYWRFVKYRAGFYYGNDYVNLGTTRPDYGITLGTATPLTSLRKYNSNGFIMLNSGIEIGQRGSKQNQSLRESIFRVNFGISISDFTWFQKRKYF